MIAIVGGGCSGLLVAAHLLERSPDLDLTIFEPHAELGRGVAYSTPWPQHLLNVPAAQMSALASRPLHFVEWLESRGYSDVGAAFMPRGLYGEYLRAVLDETERSAGTRLRHVRSEVLGIEAVDGAVSLRTADGGTHRATQVVLALGNAAPAPLRGLLAEGTEPRFFSTAWQPGALLLNSREERVLLIGSGLTAIDCLLAFEAQGHRGLIHVVSRRGRLPQPHVRSPAGPQAPSDEVPVGLRRLVRGARERARGAEDWRAVVDGFRPRTNGLWQFLSSADRARFARHVKPYWDSHRHRMAPEIGEVLERCRESGRLHVHAGRVRRLAATSDAMSDAGGDALQLALDLRGGGAFHGRIDRAINCTGIAERYDRSRRPLIQALIANRSARVNGMGTGFATDADGALIDAAGRVSDRLFTLGPPRSGDLLETIAVPEIRRQAEILAARLVPDGRVADELLSRV
jgi:uncharacterized NAD(P)/FAD-binding protein YdhS